MKFCLMKVINCQRGPLAACVGPLARPLLLQEGSRPRPFSRCPEGQALGPFFCVGTCAPLMAAPVTLPVPHLFSPHPEPCISSLPLSSSVLSLLSPHSISCPTLLYPVLLSASFSLWSVPSPVCHQRLDQQALPNRLPSEASELSKSFNTLQFDSMRC